jgi:peptidyl-prolyl cis-trans isomerase C
LLDQLIGFKLLAQESAARKATVTDAELEKRLDQIRSQFPSEEVFQQQLKQRQLTLEKLRSDTRANMQITAMLEAELGVQTAVTPEQVNDFYVKNPAAFQQGERVKASHILIRVQANAEAAEREKALAKATAILADVKAGKDFAALAKEHSDDPGSKASGGDLGYFQRGQMVPPFEQAAFALKPGEISDVVTTQFGYHVIKLTERKDASTVPFEQVKPRVVDYLTNEKKQQRVNAFIEEAKKRAKIEVLV